MRRAAATLLLVLAGCGRPVPPWPAPPAERLDLEIAVSPTTAALLQPVTVQLDLFRANDLDVTFAPAVDANDFACETRTEPPVPLGDGVWQRTTLVLRPLRGPGELVLPSFTAKAEDGSLTATTPEQKIVVESSLPKDDPEVAEAPGAPFPAPADPTWGILAAAGMFLLLVAASFWLQRTRAVRRQDAEVAVPPHVKALRALARLRAQGRTTPAEIEAFYVGVSAVLREYLEERFGLRAPERTTEEFLRELEGGDALAREHREELRRFLSQCDLVKFAAVVPAETEHLATFAIAQAFVETTRADRRPVGVSA